ncbi:hypothetical protein NMY22_g8587 [Coprinellus aureogranulatus]|nr:hypothetical protein NMY22_g8587 [Coprinellus aureogranulatus]
MSAPAMMSVSSMSPISRTQHPLAASNAPPSAQEAAFVQEQIEEVERRRSQLAQILAQTQSQLDGANAQLQTLKSIVSPIRRLPVEVLGEIFLMVPASRYRPKNRQRSVARLSLVCKSWRNAANLTPRLWCDMWIQVDVPGISYESLAVWASRAGIIQKTLEISSARCGVRCSRRTWFIFQFTRE